MASLLPHNLVRMFSSLVLVYSVFGSWPLTSASSPPIASPATEAQLICHTDNPAECYPKVFSATDQFQVVHDDQDLPPGLHVQLDIQTGQKQAKLYNPDEENPALAGLPVSQDVIVVDHEPVHDNEPRIPANAPTYEPVGIIKPPQEKSDEFSLALQTIKKSTGQQAIDANVREALEVLEDFSHHIYYGLQIAKDVEAVQSLFCLLFGGDSTRSSTERADFLAASVLSASVGNNARALAAIEASWDSIAEKQCKSGSHSIKHELFKGLAPRSEPGTELETEEANRIRLYLTVMSGLMKSLKIRTEFLEDNGMQNFLQTLLRNGKVWEPAQVKVALITSDTFLDEDFGATLGVWPTQPQVDASKCAEDGSPSLGDECWAYHLEKMSSSGDAPEWRKRLLSLIRHTQPPSSPSDTLPRHNEL
ncbi:hypothetical protein GGR50DRAFT_691754 [Xylaria sp. CBS 124048]|nr:hypothetical protein GGR50DRAFT_691754 [Xylaria sp. CBS 124048]